MRRTYNKLKLAVLETLDNAGRAMDVPELAVSVGYYPIRGFYPYCRRLARWNLIRSETSARGGLAYRLTPNGRARAAWLRRKR
jgi:hypothetical protein